MFGHTGCSVVPQRLNADFVKILVLSVLVTATYVALRRTDAVGFLPKLASMKVVTQPGLQTKPPKSTTNSVMILAYYRSGSTLTASLLRENPGTFYLFEPIRSVVKKFLASENVTLHYISGPRHYQRREKDHVIAEELESWLTCNFTSLSLESLTDIFHIQFTRVMKSFVTCAGIKYKGQQTLLEPVINNTRKLETCLDLVMQVCKRSPSIIIKTIRLPMSALADFLPEFPNMKVIHLVRDPRGQLNSQLKLDVNPKSSENRTIEMCTSLETNLHSTKTILQSFPDRVRVQRYDDLAEKPIATVKSIYAFADLTYTEKIEVFINKSTSAQKDTGPHSVMRKNSADTASKWRKTAKLERVQLIYDRCKWSMDKLGYLPFDSQQDISNMSLPSKVDANVPRNLLDV